MILGLLKKLLLGASETLAVVALVLAFFLVALSALTLSFPSGSGLVDLYGDLVLPSEVEGQVGLGRGEAGFVAVLTDVTRQVQERPVDAVAWKTARPGSRMGNHHAVQTAARSTATIAFEDRGSLELDENSLVVIKRSSTRRGLRRRGASLVLLGGEVRGRLVADNAGDVPLDIVTAGAETQILTEGEQPADFTVTVNPDNTSTLSLASGRAEVRAGGETVTVGPDHLLTIDPDGPLGMPVPIVRAPRLRSPADGARQAYGELLPQVDFRWSATRTAEAYRLTIARDAAFEEVVHDEELATAGFVHGNLREGTYYWRVTGLTGGAEGDPGTVRSFRLVEDLEPPVLEVDLPEQVEATDRLVVRGRTEPGAKVLIGVDAVTPDATGAFEHAVTLKPGVNVVVVEAVDAVGNVAYHSQYVNAKD